MIRIVVELRESGQQPRVIDVIDIANVSNLEPISDYVVEWEDKSMTNARREQFTVRRHTREGGRWKLIARVASEIMDHARRRL